MNKLYILLYDLYVFFIPSFVIKGMLIDVKRIGICDIDVMWLGMKLSSSYYKIEGDSDLRIDKAISSHELLFKSSSCYITKVNNLAYYVLHPFIYSTILLTYFLKLSMVKYDVLRYKLYINTQSVISSYIKQLQLDMIYNRTHDQYKTLMSMCECYKLEGITNINMEYKDGTFLATITYNPKVFPNKSLIEHYTLNLEELFCNGVLWSNYNSGGNLDSVKTILLGKLMSTCEIENVAISRYITNNPDIINKIYTNKQ